MGRRSTRLEKRNPEIINSSTCGRDITDTDTVVEGGSCQAISVRAKAGKFRSLACDPA